MRVVVLGLSITSAWGNGHATTYRGLVRELARRGHEILFLERDVPWYRDNRDAPAPEGCAVRLYDSLDDLRQFEEQVRAADAVIVGSYVPEGVAVGTWACDTATGPVCFYDIDTPVTLAKLDRRDEEYLSRELVRRYDVYLSFTGGPTLRRLESAYGARRARPLYCSVDPERYRPLEVEPRWTLGYLGTFSEDRQPTVDRLLLDVARRLADEAFVVGGPGYPDPFPDNVAHLPHVAPAEHAAFYGAQRFTLNVTRADMIRAGWSPSVRLFEAAACGVPIVSDTWEGIDDFFAPGEEILLAGDAADVLRHLAMPEDERRDVARRARARVLGGHTAAHRALELETYLNDLLATAVAV